MEIFNGYLLAMIWFLSPTTVFCKEESSNSNQTGLEMNTTINMHEITTPFSLISTRLDEDQSTSDDGNAISTPEIINIIIPDSILNDPQFPCPTYCYCSSRIRFDCAYGEFNSFPAGLRIFWLMMKRKPIRTLDMSHNNITEITDNDLRNLIVLTLYMDNNPLRYISKDAFLYVYNLIIVSFSRTLLHQLPGEFLFSPQSRVKELFMNGMYYDLNITEGAFKHLQYLEKLELYDNNISYIDAKAFRGLNSLKQLYLTRCELTSVPKALKSLSMLEILHLNENRIHKIQSDAFINLNNLTDLRIDNNQITTQNIHIKSFLPFAKSLQMFSLSKNPLLTIPSGMTEISQLQYLYLFSCNITDIESHVFSSFKSTLKHLDLGGNKIDFQRSAEAFTGMRSNLELHITHNEIKEWPKKLFEQLRVVGYLDLSNNLLSKVDKDTFGNLKADYLDLGFNRLTDIHPDSLTMFKSTPSGPYSTTGLVLTGNELTNICFLTKLPLGMSLYLEQNMIECSCEFYKIALAFYDSSEISGDCLPDIYYPTLQEYMLSRNINCSLENVNDMSSMCSNYYETTNENSASVLNSSNYCILFYILIICYF